LALRQFRIWAVVAVAFVGAGCSGGGGGHSVVTVPDSHRVRDLACRSKYPPESLTALNADVSGPAKRLVPIVAWNVLVCRYGAHEQLLGSGLLPPLLAAPFEVEANQLPKLRKGAPLPDCPADIPHNYYVTFANDTQRVSVGDEGPCGYLTNGVILVSSTQKWIDELVLYSASPPKTSTT
jgi:hypothetical protein